MPVIGTYKTDVAFDAVRINAMSRQTVDESLDKLQEIIKRRTPVGGPYGPYAAVHGRRSGKLRDSVHRTEPRRIAKNAWQGKVYSDLDYTAAIEYGMAPRTITSKSGTMLWFTGATAHYAKKIEITGYLGHFMFTKGAKEFERDYAEQIAANNAKIYLYAVDAGRRTVSI